ncbi:RbsD/FucU domain-containing protein [Zhihengliuella salsuginis]|uniref:D-ribose pyranase n=1 Tax=Zhihengliuella salsuginis TaxID=578222 RepID=A0ABQ3GJ55_9MICC|nr:RbsD/FucU domain-containing protein [Zhihengliuella salsuginis]GHD05652.1 L-fucose mutarotase [Zhihengliuella salsuginis]
MLRTTITHPEALAALARAGHGSLLLVADAHFASATALGPNAATIHAALAPGAPLVPEVARLLATTLAIEEVMTMEAPDAGLARAGRESTAAVRDATAAQEVPHTALARDEFFAHCSSRSLALCIVSGDRRRFANLLLRVGVTDPEPA